MLSWWQAVILGIVEGITEFLPISSTGHLILAGHLLHISSSEFYKTFEIFIQLGAIGAVVLLYWRQFFNYQLLFRLLVAFLPTAILGLIFYSLIKKYLLGNWLVVVSSLFLGGIFLWWFEKRYQTTSTINNLTDITLKQACLIGFFQTIAFVPGVSRAAATIIGGLILGLKRQVIVEFSFLLAVPTMLAASVLDLYKSQLNFTNVEITNLAIGFIVALITAVLVIRWLLNFIQRKNFIPFAWYRMAVAIIFILIFFFYTN